MDPRPQPPSKSTPQPTLPSARLVLRPLEPGDAPALQQLAARFEVAGTTVNIPHPYPDGGGAWFIDAQTRAWREDSAATWAITRDGAFIGCISLLLVSREHGRARIGYWIAPAEWNRGYATEAVRRVVEWAFSDGWQRVEADHLCRNPASGRVMQKAGLRHEGRRRAYYRRFDVLEDVELYAILRDDR